MKKNDVASSEGVEINACKADTCGGLLPRHWGGGQVEADNTVEMTLCIYVNLAFKAARIASWDLMTLFYISVLPNCRCKIIGLILQFHYLSTVTLRSQYSALFVLVYCFVWKREVGVKVL